MHETVLLVAILEVKEESKGRGGEDGERRVGGGGRGRRVGGEEW